MKRVNVVLPLVLLGAVAVASAARQEGAWEVPEEERAVENPLEATSDVLAEGGALYERRCQLCHGAELKGDGPATARIKPAPPDISTADARARLTDGEIFYKITVGKRPMPAMEGRLTEDEIWSVVHYLRSLQAE